MTNSRKSQSEKLATGGGRETTAVKPDNKRRGVDTFNDKQSQTAERKTGDGRGPGDHSSEARIMTRSQAHKEA